ncbi:MAG: hypothetical protein HGA71_07715 [Azonexaceae bacterium]|nr:hypothetical protein [Azonexaceae bacterium]
MTNFHDARIFITGASGKHATQVLRALDAHGARYVTAGSWNPTRISGPAERKLRVDFDDPASLDEAFKGINRLLIVSTDALGEPDHRGSEETIMATGIPYTILRNNWYLDNLLFTQPPVLASMRWYTASGNEQVGYVTRADCAAAAAGALLTEEQSSILDIAGPAALSADAQAGAISQQQGKPIEVVQVADDALEAGMREAGVPAPLVKLMVAFDANVRAGHMNVLNDAVRRLAGRVPQALSDWLAANRAALVGMSPCSNPRC